MQGRIAYRQQFTRCGKQRCRKCKEGEGHGPYWYAYWSENGRTKSKYIGVRLPPELATAQQGDPSSEGEVAQSVPPHISPPALRTSPAHDSPFPRATHREYQHIPSSSQDVVVPPATTRDGTLRIYLLGQFRVERRIANSWQTIDSQAWQHRRARSLLGCLLSNPEHRLGREQVMKLLWPDLDRDIAANRLNGAVHELRHILEPDVERGADFQLLRLERDTLELVGSTQVWVDAEAFEQLLRRAATAAEAEEQERLLEEAVALYKGSYLLEELYSEWATPRRDALQQHWIDSLLKLATLRAARGSLLEAIAAIDRLRATDPTNETALQQLMVYLTLLHRRGEAIRIYRQHAAMLKRDYESPPQPETRTLYNTLRQGRVPDEYLASLEAARATMAIRSGENEREAIEPAGSPAPASDTSAAAFARPVWQPAYTHQRPFIGRQSELEAMQQMLSTLATPRAIQEREHPHFTLLTGDPGMGKTRFMEELGLAAYTRGWLVAWSGASEEANTISLSRELLGTEEGRRGGKEGHDVGKEGRRQAGAPTNHDRDHPVVSRGASLPAPFSTNTSSSDPTPFVPTSAPSSDPVPTISNTTPYALWTPILRLLTPPGREQGETLEIGKQEQLQFWEAIQARLLTACQSYPLLLLLDDLQWADEDSIGFLSYLLNRLQQQPILIVAACREAELAGNAALSTLLADLRRKQMLARLPLQPLPANEIAKLVADLPQVSAQSIVAQAAGNPFFALALAQQAEQSPAQTTQTLPEAITSIFERYLSRVSDECLHLLRQATAFGETFSLNQLLSLAGEQEQDEDTVLDLLEEALQARLLREEGAGSRITYSFWHPLLVKYLYADNRPH